MQYKIAGAVDRSGNIYLKVAKIGTTSLDSETVKRVYGQVLKHATTLCTDGLYVYRELSKEYGLQHYSFPKKKQGKARNISYKSYKLHPLQNQRIYAKTYRNIFKISR